MAASPGTSDSTEANRFATAAAAPLGHLFEKLSRQETVPRASKYAGLQFFEVVPPPSGELHSHAYLGGLRQNPPEFSRYNLIFSRSGAALWLCRNVVTLFAELGRVVARQNANKRLDPLKLTTLILDFLTTQTADSSTQDQARDLCTLMLSMGVGLLPADTDWATNLRELALGQAQEPEYVPVSPLIRWAIEIETDNTASPVADRQRSLEQLVLQNPQISGFELNQWAYFLLSLQLSRAALPLATQALVTAGTPEYFPERVRSSMNKGDLAFNLGAVRDTLGWALCFAGRYEEAEDWLAQSLVATPQASVLAELRYHQAHALFWGKTPQRAVELVQTMQAESAKSVWTQRAADLISTSTPACTSSEKRHYDIVISFAGEDRAYAEALANGLVAKGLSVFYDDFERSVLWGHNLYEYLTDLYQNRARYCVVLVSRHYAAKRWTRLEWRAIQARCFRECEPLLPTDSPGRNGTSRLAYDYWISVFRTRRHGYGHRRLRREGGQGVILSFQRKNARLPRS
jgi:hypothetical protein